MQCYLISFPGIYFGAYGLVLAPNETTARELVLTQGIDDRTVSEIYEITNITDQLTQVGSTYLIWDGDY